MNPFGDRGEAGEVVLPGRRDEHGTLRPPGERPAKARRHRIGGNGRAAEALRAAREGAECDVGNQRRFPVLLGCLQNVDGFPEPGGEGSQRCRSGRDADSPDGAGAPGALEGGD